EKHNTRVAKLLDAWKCPCSRCGWSFHRIPQDGVETPQIQGFPRTGFRFTHERDHDKIRLENTGVRRVFEGNTGAGRDQEVAGSNPVSPTSASDTRWFTCGFLLVVPPFDRCACGLSARAFPTGLDPF